MNSELTRRVAFTLGALLVYRIGAHIPLPGIDLSVWGQFFRAIGGGLLDEFAGPSGGGIARLALFSLNLTPLFSAAIFIQILLFLSGRFRRFARSGERGRAKVARYTFVLALVLAIFQAYGVALGLEGVSNLVYAPGLMFRISTVLTLAGGTVFLIWLCHQITLRGIGNGIAWIVFLSIVMAISNFIARVLGLVRTGAASADVLLVLVVLSVAAVGFVVFVELARRRVPIQFAARQIGSRAFEPRASTLSFKLNNVGLVPAVVASWFLSIPLAVGPIVSDRGAAWAEMLTNALAPGQLGYLIYLMVGIVIVALLYTAFLFDPDAAAESLQRQSGALPGVAPGEPTAIEIDKILSRVTIVGAGYLALVFLVPVVLITYAHVPFYLGGASLLIVVCVVLDIGAQIRGHNNIEPGGLRA
jgi:preprotein translocase subunit SecY